MDLKQEWEKNLKKAKEQFPNEPFKKQVLVAEIWTESAAGVMIKSLMAEALANEVRKG